MYYSHCNPDDPVCDYIRQRNISDINLMSALFPEAALDDHIDTYITSVSQRTGFGTQTVIGGLLSTLLLRKFEALREVVMHGHVDQRRLAAIAQACERSHHEGLEKFLVKLLTPTVAGQSLPGPRALKKRINDFLKRVEPAAASKPRERDVDVDNSDPDSTKLSASLPSDEGLEVERILSKVAKENNISRAEALLKLVRGQVQTKVIFYLYGTDPTHPDYLLGLGKLDDAAAEFWAGRITDIRNVDEAVLAHTNRYQPTPDMRGYVAGRDGTCRYPGCNVSADRTDKDHVIPYPDGPTTPANLLCLCRHHHNLKSAGHVHVRMLVDGLAIWTLPDGTQVVTEPTGPLSKRHRAWTQTIRQWLAKRHQR